MELGRNVTKQKKQVEVITKDMEDFMWTTGVLGDRNPEQLVETLLYVPGLHLAPKRMRRTLSSDFSRR